MSNQEIRTGFDQMIQAATVAGDRDAVSRLELAREYFADPAFKARLEDFVWQVNAAAR